MQLSLARYDTGLTNYIEVLDAEELLYPAEAALAQTRRDQLVAVVNLYKALGGGWDMRELASGDSELSRYPSARTPFRSRAAAHRARVRRIAIAWSVPFRIRRATSDPGRPRPVSIQRHRDDGSTDSVSRTSRRCAVEDARARRHAVRIT